MLGIASCSHYLARGEGLSIHRGIPLLLHRERGSQKLVINKNDLVSAIFSLFCKVVRDCQATSLLVYEIAKLLVYSPILPTTPTCVVPLFFWFEWGMRERSPNNSPSLAILLSADLMWCLMRLNKTTIGSCGSSPSLRETSVMES